MNVAGADALSAELERRQKVFLLNTVRINRGDIIYKVLCLACSRKVVVWIHIQEVCAHERVDAQELLAITLRIRIDWLPQARAARADRTRTE